MIQFIFVYLRFSYKRKRIDGFAEEEERQVRKYAKISERLRTSQNKFFGANEISELSNEWQIEKFSSILISTYFHIF